LFFYGKEYILKSDDVIGFDSKYNYVIFVVNGKPVKFVVAVLYLIVLRAGCRQRFA
jgi:hypothetical protein